MSIHLTKDQKLAYKYYRAFGHLCCHTGENYTPEEHKELLKMRKKLIKKYKKYDPNSTFDLSKDYDI